MKMIVQKASFKGKQIIRETIPRSPRKGKTARDKASGAWARGPQNVRDRQARYDELK